ncbi:MAG: hypothetical protein GX546_04685, partial [Acholeplasmataceae bacterium]|nr:hypothetical protein [Acholeplasmataceae bacterium]
VEGYIEQHYNPYDYDEIDVYAEFTSPTGKSFTMPAFWYRDYEIVINTNYDKITSVSGMASSNPDEIQGLESVNWTNEPKHYRLRVILNEVGTYTYGVYVVENGIPVQYLESEVMVLDNQNSNNIGIIKVDPATNRNFIDGSGNSFIPVGVNLCWWTNNTRKTYDYDVWMEKMNQNNINMMRLWMATWGFALHWGKDYNNFDTRLNAAARLDKVFDLADKYSIYIQLVLVNHGQFSSQVNAEWQNNPYNSKNGGIIDTPQEFFSNLEARRTFKNEMRYIMARYGYSDKIMAWELFNEVDWTDAADSSNRLNIYNWHREMGEYMKSIDPYNHMITTSYKTNTGMAYSLNVIDYTNPHDYGYEAKSVVLNLPDVQESVIDRYKKPTIQSEIGINWRSGVDTRSADPTGISIRQALWAGMLGGAAGAAMQWWWDSWIHPNDLWTVFNGAGIFAKEMNLVGGKYTQLKTGGTVTILNEDVKILGYQYNDRVYGYLFDQSWSHMNKNVSMQSSTIVINMPSGNYTLEIYNALTGAVILTNQVESVNGKLNFSITFTEDVAFIIKK